MSEKNKTILFGKEFHIGTDDRTGTVSRPYN